MCITDITEEVLIYIMHLKYHLNISVLFRREVP